MVQIHQIKPKTKNKSKKRVGRGGKRGTYSGKGLKGQKSRAGRKMRPEIRSDIKRIPKKRGYRFKSIQEPVFVINLDILETRFEKGEEINPGVLFDKKLIRKTGGKLPIVKILSRGDITKNVKISACQFSKLAKEKIEKAGGSIE
ncbi:MAG: uL15m family ribosomal protein [Patescibacteria group bacterium]